MGMFSMIRTAASGLTAQKLRQDVISNNIANVDTTRTPQGGPFHRSRVVFRPRVSSPYWRSPFLPTDLQTKIGDGVRVVKIQEDKDAKPRLVWDPTHPDAIKTGKKAGYVEYPNVNIVQEMVDLISSSRAYEANLSVVSGAKGMFKNAVDIGI